MTTTTTTAAKKPAAPKVDMKQIEEAVTVGKQTVEKMVKASTDNYEQAMAATKDAVAATKEHVEKASAAVMKAYDDIAVLNKEGVDAYVSAGNIVAKGMEDLSKAMFAFAQTSAEANVATAKALMGAKTVTDVFTIQAEFARSQFDSMIAESTKLSEYGLKVANEAFEPLQAQANATVEKLFKPIAA